MAAREVNASTFKAKCLGLLDEVAETGREITVTKRGKPVARVLPAEEAPDLRGTITFNVSDDELVEALDEAWDVDRPWSRGPARG
ncbi:type II toxin-antitoxin system Phd/YefM family antitoxin [soil metagenome]